MSLDLVDEGTDRALAEEYCLQKGEGWSVTAELGRGGTAQVFEVRSPSGNRALKIFSQKYSQGERREESKKRIAKQVKLGDHECPYLIKTFDGGDFADRLFILMNCASGKELEKQLPNVPRSAIPTILDQIAQACIFLQKKGLCHRDIKSANVVISDDFTHATLLDTSVLREINDPLGVGTDDGDHLPVVATSRYSPPEYLFRLIETGPALWHAVNIYQLGGILHDLIMRAPLFEKEYQITKDNKYRFAWIVATVNPPIQADDVPSQYLTLARRALDKEHPRRSLMQLEDFTSGIEIKRKRARELLGFGKSTEDGVDIPKRLKRISTIAQEIEEGVTAYLKEQGVIAVHQISNRSDNDNKLIKINWKSATGQDGHEFIFSIELGLEGTHSSPHFIAELQLQKDSLPVQAATLPPYPDDDNSVEQMKVDINTSLTDLATKLI